MDAEAIVFYPKAKIMVTGADKLTAQAREAGAAVAGRARDATSAAAQTAAQAASKSVREGVFSARGWVAPRLESVADYTTDTVAPKVSSVLRDTARQISPPDSRNKNFRFTLRWLLATAAFATAGAAALLVRQRHRAGMAADSENVEAPAQSMSATGAEPADTGANGKVSASG